MCEYKVFYSDYHPVDPVIRLINEDDKVHTTMKETVIGNNVFISCNVIILEGVHIDNNAVIGTDSNVSNATQTDYCGS